jgi:hypothetical protein
MKKRKVLQRLNLNKKTIANLDRVLISRAKGGTDIRTFTEPAWLACDIPACLTQQFQTCDCPDPDTTGEPYCQLCNETDPISCL